MAWTYCITDRKTSEVPTLQHIRQIIRAGVDFLQIREKDLPARELYRLALKARAMARGHTTRILINDRLDIALAADLDGVHLAQTSMPADAIRARVSRKGFLIGPPVTPSALREAVQHSNRPVFALGGIDLHNYLDCLKQGAAGIAGIRLFQRPDPGLGDLVSAISSRGAGPYD